METCRVVLTFESVDEILWCDHSNETSSALLLHGTICFSICYKMKFGILYKFLSLVLMKVERLKAKSNCPKFAGESPVRIPQKLTLKSHQKIALSPVLIA